MTEREQRVRAVVASVSGADISATSRDEALFDTGIIDSFGLADLVSSLQSEFGIQIPDSDLHPRNFGSIQAIEMYLSYKS